MNYCFLRINYWNVKYKKFFKRYSVEYFVTWTLVSVYFQSNHVRPVLCYVVCSRHVSHGTPFSHVNVTDINYIIYCRSLSRFLFYTKTFQLQQPLIVYCLLERRSYCTKYTTSRMGWYKVCFKFSFSMQCWNCVSISWIELSGAQSEWPMSVCICNCSGLR